MMTQVAALRREKSDSVATRIDQGDTADSAVAPAQIPAQSWPPLLARAARHVLEARLPLLSAGVAFFAVLSIAPVLVAAISVYGAVNTPAQALDQLSRVAEVLPAQVEPIVADQLTSITTASNRVLTVRGLAGLVIALWTATTAMVSLIDALTVAYHETETRGLVRRTSVALAFVLGGAVLLGAVLTLGRWASRRIDGAPDALRTAAPVVTWFALGGLMIAALAFLYRYAPDRKQARWRWTTWGATGATVLWLATSVVLFAYVRSLGTYESTYGSLAGVAISMFWLWMTVLLVVIGAAVNGEAERQTSRDSTVGAERPLGERGAEVADTLPPPRVEQ
jgi:membrane protein